MKAKRKSGEFMRRCDLRKQCFDSHIAERQQERKRDTILCFRRYLLRVTSMYMSKLWDASSGLFANAFLFFPTGTACEVGEREEDVMRTSTLPSHQDLAPLVVNPDMWTLLQWFHQEQETSFSATVLGLTETNNICDLCTGAEDVFCNLDFLRAAEHALGEEVSANDFVISHADPSIRCEVRIVDEQQKYRLVKAVEPDVWMYADNGGNSYLAWINPNMKEWPVFKAALNTFFMENKDAKSITAPAWDDQDLGDQILAAKALLLLKNHNNPEQTKSKTRLTSDHAGSEHCQDIQGTVLKEAVSSTATCVENAQPAPASRHTDPGVKQTCSVLIQSSSEPGPLPACVPSSTDNSKNSSLPLPAAHQCSCTLRPSPCAATQNAKTESTSSSPCSSLPSPLSPAGFVPNLQTLTQSNFPVSTPVSSSSSTGSVQADLELFQSAAEHVQCRMTFIHTAARELQANMLTLWTELNSVHFSVCKDHVDGGKSRC